MKKLSKRLMNRVESKDPRALRELRSFLDQFKPGEIFESLKETSMYGCIKYFYEFYSQKNNSEKVIINY